MEAITDPQAANDADLLADSILKANRMIKEWQAYKDAMTSRLTNLHSKGFIPTKFEAHGHAFSLREGKLNITFDSIAKERINFLKDDLTLEGHSQAKRGAAFWDTRVLKECKGSKSEATVMTQQSA